MLFDPLAINTAVYAVLMAFTVNIALCPIIIPHLTRLKVGQNIRSDGPQSHLSKKGTPTMGGVMILLSFFVVALLFLRDNSDGLVLLFVTLGFGAIGFCDDYVKVVKRRSLGLRAWQKLVGQFAVGIIFLAYLMLMRGDDSPTSILLPFTTGLSIELSYLLYIPFFFITLGGTVNGVNLTDGLDGLAAGVTLLIATFFTLAAWAAGSPVTAVAAGAAGSLLGFLLYNAHPAKVFMGDTGSLALGGFIAGLALLLKMPLFIPIVGIIYVIETLSVIIQVGYFKWRKERFFKMAPIHHSFELSGWSETKVVTLFYVITAIACLIGFLAAQQLF